MADTASDWAIDLKDVAKIYKGKVHALQGIEMRVRRGEVFGLLGPNGAGKSTLVKIMMTVIRPTRAEGTVLGNPVGDKPTLARVGYLPENHRFPKYLTGRQTLEFFGALGKVDRPTSKRRAKELLDIVGMTDWGDRKVSTYSKGMLQRVGLAQALMSDPDLVVLDEPTDGVDPVGRRDIQSVFHRLRDQGKSVFINSHLLPELESIADRVAILVKGRVVKQGTMDELTREQQKYEVELFAADVAAATAMRPRVLEALRGLGATLAEKTPAPAPVAAAAPRPAAAAGPPGAPPPLLGYGGGPRPLVGPYVGIGMASPYAVDTGKTAAGLWVQVEGPLIQVGTTDPAAVQPVIDAVRAAGLTVRRVAPVRQSLEDLFMEAVTDPFTGQAMTPGASRRPGPPGPGGFPVQPGFPGGAPPYAGPPPGAGYPPPPSFQGGKR